MTGTTDSAGGRADTAGAPLLKVCGFTSEHDLTLAAGLGLWAVGFILADSPRRMTPEDLPDLVRYLRREAGGTRGPLAVGVFSGHEPVWVAEVVTSAGLDGAQLHGAESPEEVRELRGLLGSRLLIKTISVPPPSEEPGLRSALVEEAAAPYADFVDFMLLDTAVRGMSGGTGVSFDWSVARALAERVPVIVAGGIGPDTARRALEVSGAAGLDVCSGVEAVPGRKDPAALTALVAAVRPGSGGSPRVAPGRSAHDGEEPA